VPQRNAVISSVVCSPMSARGTLHGNLESFSSGKGVLHDARSSRALGRLVDKTRRGLMMDSVPCGIQIDGSEGAMIKLAESMSLLNLIERHNNVNDPFHLDEPLCFGLPNLIPIQVVVGVGPRASPHTCTTRQTMKGRPPASR
jgi:hypothetical protein